MDSHFGHRPVRPPRRISSRILILGMWMGALLVGLSAETAEASCGDWLEHPTATAGEVASPEQPPLAPVPPCNGPGCRQAPLAPLPPVPASPSTFSQDVIATLGQRVPSALDSGAAAYIAAIDSESAGYPLRVDRPPRV